MDYFAHVLGSVIQGMSLGSWVTSEMQLHMLHGEKTEYHRIEYMGLHTAEGITLSTLFHVLVSQWTR